MWFGMTLWTTVFIALCLAHNSLSDSHWNDLENIYDNPGDLLALNTWPDSIIMPRQLFEDKSTEGVINEEEGRRRRSMEEDLPKNKRESHSLSIVNPLDVLRQRLMLEMARRRMKENQDQIRENALILKNLGKRSGEESRRNKDYIRRIQMSGGFNV